MTFRPDYQVPIGILTPHRNFSTASMILQDALDRDRSTLVGVCKRSRESAIDGVTDYLPGLRCYETTQGLARLGS